MFWGVFFVERFQWFKQLEFGRGFGLSGIWVAQRLFHPASES